MRRRSEIAGIVDMFSPVFLYMVMCLAVTSVMEAVWTYALQGAVQSAGGAAQIYAMQGGWNCLFLILPGAAGCLFVRRTLFREIRAFTEKYPGAVRRIPQQMIPVLMTAAVSLSVAVNVLFSLSAQGGTGPALETGELPGIPGFLMQMLVYGVCVPLIEESIFRGILLSRAEKMYGLLPAVLVSAAVFGAYHAAPVQGAYAFVMGIVFAVSYAGTGRFAVPFGLHGMCNLMILLLNRTGAYRAVCTPWWDAAFFVIAAAGFYTVFHPAPRH